MVSIDGTDISGATIDGSSVSEITIDGTVAWTAKPASGLAKWTMDNTTADEWGNYPLTLKGATYNGGYSGDSLDFERSNGDYARTQSTNIWNTIASNDQFSFVGWVWLEQDDQEFSALVGNNSPGNDSSFKIGVNGGGNNNYNMFMDMNNSTVKTDSNRLNTNTWIHVGFTWDGSTCRLYKNGSQISSGDMSESIPDSGDYLYLGVWTGGGNPDWYDGRIDEVQIHDKQLSGSEVNNHYNTGSI